jgi:methionine sulfoxide reductase heme-binding subunit
VSAGPGGASRRPSTSAQPATRSPNRLGRPLGTGRGWRRRLLLHHVPLALASAAVLLLFLGLAPFATGAHPELDTSSREALPTARDPSSRPMQLHNGTVQPAGPTLRFELPSRVSVSQLTVASGYVALGLLGMTLLIGPANLLLRRRNPVSNSLRRDAGTWTAIFSVVHVVLGLQLHGRGLSRLLGYFVAEGRPLTSSFGLGNWTGLAALVLVVGLLALSTDRSLGELKASRWKSLQRLNYALFALVVLHAFFYGALLHATSPFTLLLSCIVAAVFLGQAAGIWLWRRRHARTAASHHERRPMGRIG